MSIFTDVNAVLQALNSRNKLAHGVINSVVDRVDEYESDESDDFHLFYQFDENDENNEMDELSPEL